MNTSQNIDEAGWIMDKAGTESTPGGAQVVYVETKAPPVIPEAQVEQKGDEVVRVSEDDAGSQNRAGDQ
jgi:hypothetical protein